jgi:hypothetical protein
VGSSSGSTIRSTVAGLAQAGRDRPRLDAAAPADRRGDRRGQRDPHLAFGHRHHVEGGPAGRRPQKAADVAEHVLLLAPLIDQHPGRDVARQQHVVDARQPAVGAEARSRRRRHRQGRPADRGIDGQAGVAVLAVELPGAIGGREATLEIADRLAGAEKQVTVEPQREVERGQGAGLRPRLEVDEDVAAAHQIDAVERHVLQEVVGREQHPLAHARVDDEAAVGLGDEVLAAQLGRHAVEGLGRVGAVAGDPQRLAVDVGREHPQVRRALAVLELAQEQDGQGVGLLAGGAAGDPHPDVVAGRHRGDDLRDHLIAQHLEGQRIAEEARDADQEVAAELGQLSGVGQRPPAVVLDRRAGGELHAPADAAVEGSGLVDAEVDVEHVAEPIEQGGEAAHLGHRHRRVGEVVGAAAGVGHQVLGDLLGGQHAMDEAGADRGARHAVEAGGALGLRQGQATGGVDVAHARRAVGAGARQDDRDRVVAPGGGQRAEEPADRQVDRRVGQALDEVQAIAVDQHLLARGQEVDRVGRDRGRLDDLQHRHAGEPRQELVHQALEVGRQVLDDDERHAGVGRHGLEQALEGLEATRRRTDPDHEGRALVRTDIVVTDHGDAPGRERLRAHLVLAGTGARHGRRDGPGSTFMALEASKARTRPPSPFPAGPRAGPSSARRGPRSACAVGPKAAVPGSTRFG